MGLVHACIPPYAPAAPNATTDSCQDAAQVRAYTRAVQWPVLNDSMVLPDGVSHTIGIHSCPFDPVTSRPYLRICYPVVVLMSFMPLPGLPHYLLSGTAQEGRGSARPSLQCEDKREGRVGSMTEEKLKEVEHTSHQAKQQINHHQVQERHDLREKNTHHAEEEGADDLGLLLEDIQEHLPNLENIQDHLSNLTDIPDHLSKDIQEDIDSIDVSVQRASCPFIGSDGIRERNA